MTCHKREGYASFAPFGIFCFLGVLAVLSLGAITCLWAAKMSLVAPGQQVLGYLSSASTTYANQYSDDGWLKVSEGMPRAEVLVILGKPLKKGSHGLIESWEYSEPNVSESYQLRQIHFIDGAVYRKLDTLYVD